VFRRILIANRGEIALRVIQACRELGIETVAVHSTADADSLHVAFADHSVCLGPADSARSYLNMNAVIAAAEITDADAIHPGYGYLAENARFVEICQACGITFIGPSAEVMRGMGDKVAARRLADEAGVPVLPGSPGALGSLDEALSLAGQMGFPVILKASAGGGGRGIRVVNTEEGLRRAFSTAQVEARAAFGVPDVYLEKYLVNPRHVEFQVMGDRFGTVTHYGERECSVQRRHQKLLEEAPSCALDARLRESMGDAALRLCRRVGYLGAGTVEFLLDEDGGFYFMEMNTRIQVEHPVTEMVTGVDLIQQQIAMAAGEPLPHGGRVLSLRGHAIECRINAEDPDTFVPSPGRITVFHPPGGIGVRLDTAMHSAAVVPPHYDSMIAKLIVHAPTRPEAIARMTRALEMFVVEGIKTSIPLHLRILADGDFRAGRLSTRFMERFARREP
jgi:acetyl-CoA carboxylase biotin carboxylase subunit